MRVYVYGRVSHRSSALSGLSETSQFQTCQEYCKSKLASFPPGNACFPPGSLPGYFFDRSVSAWKTPFSARPAASELLRVLQPGDQVVFYSVDRGFRSVRAFSSQVEEWRANGITPHFVQENINFGTAVGRLMGNVMASVAQYYSDVISERTRESLRIKHLKDERKKLSPRRRDQWAISEVRLAERTQGVTTPHRPGRIFQYARCSHLDSMLSGLGMEQQIESIASYSRRLAVDRPWLTPYPEIFCDESISAFNFQFHERPSGKRLLSVLKQGDQIVVYRLDRAWRLPHDAATMAATLAKEKIGIHIVDAGIDTLSEFGQVWVNLLSVFAFLESKLKSNRNLEVAALCRQSGRPSAPTPLHCKLEWSHGKKKLVYDFEQIKRMAICYLCREVMGLSERTTCEIVHAIDCSLTGRKPVWIGLRKQMWGGRGRTSRGVRRFIELKDIIHHEQLSEVMHEAAQLLETNIAEQFCTFLSIPFPLNGVSDRLRGWER